MEALEWVRSEMLHALGHEVDREVGPRLFDLIFEAQLRRLPAGGAQPMSDWRTVREFLHSPFVLAAMESPVALVFLAIVFMMHPLLGWVTLGGAIVQVGLAALTERWTQPPLAAANRSAQAAHLYADGSLRNAEVIEAMGMLRDIHSRWIAVQGKFLGLQAQASMAAGGLQALSKMVQQVLGSALLGLGAWLLLRNQLPGGPGLMIVASIIGARVLAPLVQMVAQWRGVVQARDAWARLERLMDALPIRPPSMPLPAPRGVLSVEQLVASAPVPPGQPATPILKGVNFTLQPGEILAVIGPSASGKTTLARLLVGLWPAASGKVRLDGADVHAWSKRELGPFVGYLPQGVELFEGSLADNVARFGAADPKRLEAAAEAAGLHALIDGLPQRWNTPLGRDGAVLSGGQRQRVALARALYGDPILVVLDEPNSSLDEQGDAALTQALLALKARGATVVVMTHRTSVLSVTDKILLLAEGAQQAFGARDEVLAGLRKAAAQAAAGASSQAAGKAGLQLVRTPTPVAASGRNPGAPEAPPAASASSDLKDGN
jgi:ATP-binding cassette subfamily C exporter for protease/lipase